MIPGPPKPRYPSGTQLRVIQHVRVGHRRWSTWVEGEVVEEGYRPVGGMEMGGKDRATHQTTLKLRKPDGELTSVAIDECSEIQILTIPSPD